MPYTTAGYTMRHHKTVETLNGSDQITGITVEGTKDAHSGTINITVNLLDASATILDQGTATLPTSSGTYSVPISLIVGTVPYVTTTAVQVICAN